MDGCENEVSCALGTGSAALEDDWTDYLALTIMVSESEWTDPYEFNIIITKDCIYNGTKGVLRLQEIKDFIRDFSVIEVKSLTDLI